MQDHLFYPHAPLRPTIDVTPDASWRRTARTAVVVVMLTLALPLTWMLGALIAFALLGAVAVSFGCAYLSSGLRRRRVVRRSDDTIDMR